MVFFSLRKTCTNSGSEPEISIPDLKDSCRYEIQRESIFDVSERLKNIDFESLRKNYTLDSDSLNHSIMIGGVARAVHIGQVAQSGFFAKSLQVFSEEGAGHAHGEHKHDFRAFQTHSCSENQKIQTFIKYKCVFGSTEVGGKPKYFGFGFRSGICTVFCRRSID